MRKRVRWPAEPRQYRWIVDGHNAIFTHPTLEALQTAGQRSEARRRLEQMLERFAARNGLTIEVVYDGDRAERNPDARRGGRVSVVFSSSPEEEADDRILQILSSHPPGREKVVVISSDRATLGSRLPAGVLRIETKEFFRRFQGQASRERSREPQGDFSDIEEHFRRVAEKEEVNADPVGREAIKEARITMGEFERNVIEKEGIRKGADKKDEIREEARPPRGSGSRKGRGK